MAATQVSIDTVQKTYIAYYQRPADPVGLVYWANRLDVNGGNMDAIVDAFATSAEATTLYGAVDATTIATVVTGIYQSLFNRAPEAAGLAFYVDGFTAGTFTAGSIVLNVLAGAQNDDALAVNNKLDAANLFTKVVDPELDALGLTATYSGDTDAVAARTWLAEVTYLPSTAKTTAAATDYIKTAIADAGDPIGGGTSTGASFTLTNGTDIASANVFNSDQVYTPGGDDRVNSLQDEDQLTGINSTATTPTTLSAVLGNANDNGATVITPKLNSIEVINFAFTGSGGNVTGVDMQDATGITEVNITRVAQGKSAEVGNMETPVAILTLSNTNANQTDTVEFSYAAGILLGDNTATMTLNNVDLGNLNIGQNVDMTPACAVLTNGIEHLTLVSNGTANRLGTLNLPMDTGVVGNVTITGDKSLTIATNVSITSGGLVEGTLHLGGIALASGRLATVDASALTGTSTLTLNIGNTILSTGKAETSGQAQNVTITGTANNDTFYLNDVVGAGDVVDGGLGTDTLIVYNGGVTTGTVSNVESVNIQAISNVTMDLDRIGGATLIGMRNIDNNLAVAPISADRGDYVITLNNLTTDQAGALTINHSTTTNCGILDTTVVANLKVATTAAGELVGITIAEGVNSDPRFNFTLVTQNIAGTGGIENVTITDSDTESNSVTLASVAQHTNTITVAGVGVAGTFVNFDTTAHWAAGLTFDQRGSYGIDVNGSARDENVSQATALILPAGSGNMAIANVDTVVRDTAGLTAAARYNGMDNGIPTAGTVSDVRIIAQIFDASSTTSDVIARFGDITRTNGISSQLVKGGTGNDTFIFDAQGVKNSGYTSGDSVYGGAGLDTLVIDGHTTALKADGSAGQIGNVSVQKSEWDSTTGIDVLRLAGNQGTVNVGNLAIIGPSQNGGGYYIEVDNEFVRQTDAGNSLKIISNDGDLSVNLESDLVLNLRDLTQTSNVIFIGANSNATGLATALANASNRIQVADNSANGANAFDGGDTRINGTDGALVNVGETIDALVNGVTYRYSTGNNNVLQVFNTADVSINDLAQTKNFGRIEGTNDLAVAQTLKLVLNTTVMDQLIDNGTVARIAAVGLNNNVERLVVVASNNDNVAGAVENLNIDASAAGIQFGLDVVVARSTTNTIVGTSGADKVVIAGNFTAFEQAADGHAAIALFSGANATTGASLAANAVAYKGVVDGIAGTIDDVLMAYAGTFTLGATDTIEVFGGVDLSGATIAAGTNIIAHGGLRLSEAQLSTGGLGTITFTGPGTHGLQILNSTSVTAVADMSKVFVSTGAGALTVNGEVGVATTGTITVPSGYVAPVITAGVTYTYAAPVVDTVAPVFSSATVSSSTLTLNYNEALMGSSDPAGTAYSVTVTPAGGAAAARTVSSADATGNTVVLTLASAVASTDVVTVSYTVPGSNPVKDLAGNSALALAPQSVSVAAADVTPPVMTGAVVNGATLTLSYNEALLASSDPAGSAYSVTVAGVARTVNLADATGSTVVLTLASAVTSGQAVTVAYTAPATNAVKDMAGNLAAALVSGGQTVTNSTAAAGGGNTLTAATGTVPQTLTGTVGVKDTFVFNYRSDANGAFGDFGQVTVANYTRADLDVISFVNGNAALPWTTIGQFIPGGTIAANGGSSMINFADDPNVNGIASQYITLTGVTQTTAFGATLSNVAADFTFA
jgi:uncharacterized repeat protein (TIGR02059 family)